MSWASALVGFALGLASTYVILLIQRSWQRKDDTTSAKKIVKSLIVEIEEGISRAKHMAELLDQGQASLSRVYAGLWVSTSQRLAATLTESETLTLLHRIYYRFDLINFNCEDGRSAVGGAYAKQYLPEVEQNLSHLKVQLEKM